MTETGLEDNKTMSDKEKSFLEMLEKMPDWMVDLVINQINDLQKQEEELDKKFNQAISTRADGSAYTAYNELMDIAQERLAMGDNKGERIARGYAGEYLIRAHKDMKGDVSTAKQVLKIFEELDHKEGIRRIKKLIEEIKQSEE